MSELQLLQTYFETSFAFVALILAVLSYRAINSYWRKYDTKERNPFHKGETEFSDPPRPPSSTFSQYLYLAALSTPSRQEQLVQLLSDRIKETMNYHSHITGLEFSDSLTLLLDDPDQWLEIQYKKVRSRRADRKYQAAKVLHKQVLMILEEIEQHYELEILADLEET